MNKPPGWLRGSGATARREHRRRPSRRPGGVESYRRDRGGHGGSSRLSRSARTDDPEPPPPPPRPAPPPTRTRRWDGPDRPSHPRWNPRPARHPPPAAPFPRTLQATARTRLADPPTPAGALPRRWPLRSPGRHRVSALQPRRGAPRRRHTRRSSSRGPQNPRPSESSRTPHPTGSGSRRRRASGEAPETPRISRRASKQPLHRVHPAHALVVAVGERAPIGRHARVRDPFDSRRVQRRNLAEEGPLLGPQLDAPQPHRQLASAEHIDRVPLLRPSDRPLEFDRAFEGARRATVHRVDCQPPARGVRQREAAVRRNQRVVVGDALLGEGLPLPAREVDLVEPPRVPRLAG